MEAERAARPVEANAEEAVEAQAPPEPELAVDWAYIASKNAQVFHAPGCMAVKRISHANALCFATREEAESSGRRPCAKCC